MTQLTSVEAIAEAVQRYNIDNAGGSLGVRFPSGRTIWVRPDTENLAGRSRHWIRQYTVQHQGNHLELQPILFAFTRQGNRQELQRSIAGSQQRVDRWQQDMDRDRASLAALDSPHVVGPSLSDLKPLVDRWPELIDICLTNQITATFVPVIFRHSGRLAMSSSLAITIRRDSSWRGDQGAHPHMSAEGSICPGNIQGLFRATVESNQVILALDLIRRWRIGYNPGDEVSTSWAMRGWAWLQGVRNGSISTKWDGITVQDNRIGRLLPLEEALNGQIDGYIHVGQSGGWVRPPNVSLVETIPQGCGGCKGDMITCSCHGRTCVGCQRPDSWCICSGSRYVLARPDDRVWAVMPPGQYTEQCGECSNAAPNIVYYLYDRNPASIRNHARYCQFCTPQEYVARAIELRTEMEGETNDSTHEDSTPDDGAGGSEGA